MTRTIVAGSDILNMSCIFLSHFENITNTTIISFIQNQWLSPCCSPTIQLMFARVTMQCLQLCMLLRKWKWIHNVTLFLRSSCLLYNRTCKMGGGCSMTVVKITTLALTRTSTLITIQVLFFGSNLVLCEGTLKHLPALTATEPMRARMLVSTVPKHAMRCAD